MSVSRLVAANMLSDRAKSLDDLLILAVAGHIQASLANSIRELSEELTSRSDELQQLVSVGKPSADVVRMAEVRLGQPDRVVSL